MSTFTESIVEEAALDWLGALGYSLLHGPEIAAGEVAAERNASARCTHRAIKFFFLFIRKCGSLSPSRLMKRGVRVVTIRGVRGAVAARHRKRFRKGGADERCCADGQAVWSWRRDAGVKFARVRRHRADDGGKRARSPGRARSTP